MNVYTVIHVLYLDTEIKEMLVNIGESLGELGVDVFLQKTTNVHM